MRQSGRWEQVRKTRAEKRKKSRTLPSRIKSFKKCRSRIIFSKRDYIEKKRIAAFSKRDLLKRRNDCARNQRRITLWKKKWSNLSKRRKVTNRSSHLEKVKKDKVTNYYLVNIQTLLNLTVFLTKFLARHKIWKSQRVIVATTCQDRCLPPVKAAW